MEDFISSAGGIGLLRKLPKLSMNILQATHWELAVTQAL